MHLPPPFRPATAADARALAELIAISSDGVAEIEWTEAAAQQPGKEPLDMGEATYADPEGDYCYRNAVVAEEDGAVIGALLTFALPPNDAPRSPAPPYDGSDVFAPYKYLEAADSWYICGVALFPGHRGQGLGTRLLDLATAQAREHGFKQLSLVAFEKNEGAVRLYERYGFRTIDRAPIVPHPLIHYDGDALLMVKDV